MRTLLKFLDKQQTHLCLVMALTICQINSKMKLLRDKKVIKLRQNHTFQQMME